MKTAIILGTARKQGNTAQAAQLVAEQLKANIYDLSDFDISDYDYEHKNQDDDFLPLVESLIEHDHLIFASPIYWYTVSASMKTFLDRLTDIVTIKKPLGRKLSGKKASMIATGSQEELPSTYSDMLKNTYQYFKMDFLGQLYCQCEENIDIREHDLAIKDFIIDISNINHLQASSC